MIFYDFEVFKYDWLAVFADTDAMKMYVIINNSDELLEFYSERVNDIWIGYNNVHYDQYIFKGILLGMNPKEINDKIIIDGLDGWQISRVFNKIPMINYDLLPVVRTGDSFSIGLKKLGAFMGHDIKETDIPFDTPHKLTQDEIELTIKYCEHDVEETMEVFMQKLDSFNATLSIIDEFHLPMSDLQLTEAQITAKVLDCIRQDFNDEFDYYILPCIELHRYKYVQEWFEERIGNPKNLTDKEFYSESLETVVCDVEHTFSWGGGHGAKRKIHRKGALYHVDVNNYYPSLLIAWGLVTRASTNDNYTKVYNKRKDLKMKQLEAQTKELVKQFKKLQLPYKLMLNALSGAMKDKHSKAFDPRNNNIMCINGQLMLLMLIEMLEVAFEKKGLMFELIQNNTDGLIVYVDDTDEAFELLDDVCYEWECKCSTDKCEIGLALDCISEIYQGDVNNYLWIGDDGEIESKGSYVKQLNPLDYDLPIVNKAIIERLVNKTPVEKTINECQDLIMFQKIVKLSGKYNHVEHEQGIPNKVNYGKRVIKTKLVYKRTIKYDYKSYRVFASRDITDGRLLKVKLDKNPEKFANTPEHCFINNNDIIGEKVPARLDKQWYIDLAKERLKNKFDVI